MPDRAGDALLASLAVVNAEEAEAKAALDAVSVPFIEAGGTVAAQSSELDETEGCAFAQVKWVRCTSRDHHHQHVFCASAKSPTDLFCIFCAEGGGGGLTQAERKKLALTHKKADQAINAASRAVNMPASVA